MFTALTRIGLPVMVEREVYTDIVVPVASGETVYKEPGETITKAELKELGWPDEKITADMAELSKYGSIGTAEDYKAMLEREAADQEKQDARIAAVVEQELRNIQEEKERERRKEEA